MRMTTACHSFLSAISPLRTRQSRPELTTSNCRQLFPPVVGARQHSVADNESLRSGKFNAATDNKIDAGHSELT